MSTSKSKKSTTQRPTAAAPTRSSRAKLNRIPSQAQEWPGSTDALTPRPDHGEKSWTARGRLAGKRALVTGGDSGIGRAVATIFAQEGAEVMIVALPEEAEDAKATKRSIKELGGTCHVVKANLRTAKANQRVVARAVEKMGGIDVLVANAAYQMTHPELAEFPDGQVERTFETNVFSPFWLVKAAEPHLSEGDSVILTTSVQAYSPSEPLLDYAASKAALTNMAVNLASQLGPKGIRVNAVAPGPIWTPLIPSTMSMAKVGGFGSDTPLGRAGHPVEVAAAYVFLASDEASYVSGTVLGVTGGKPVF
ncbi:MULTISPECIES: SDR family oxidoreductase [unclassified Luteococcus]|uniref:SDR family oxidoreductase n=1 Tax=unclassified Luteococcus TaxID=2639923 RepID=UPI00313CAF2B